jgi:hypothetical protein
MYNYSRSKGLDVCVRMYGNALIHRARNTALATVRADADFALFVDDDMLPPKRALMKLVAHDVPVVSALCTTRQPPIEIAAKVYNPDEDQFHPLDTVNLTRMVTGQFGVGTAFTLLRRDVIDTLQEYYLSAQDWLCENRRRLDRMHVRAELREKERRHLEAIRRAQYAKDKHLRVFDYLVGENELQLGEDVTLSRRLIQLGIPVSIDGTVIVGHCGEWAYDVYDIIHEQNKLDAAVA